ncbi:hypothetical protein [Allorhodopirellula heiligendammensis]|uniref:DUF4174 domain-containing protein n=1 Tax=Allorhodopirellula heiligendammensis TaxID=2714739 RepID=A0A5C6C668_9BACT|nr:hypothetical protein [Allorhodopirellula heiligendammensis]TWU19542.1 hypothetical protein Poly21_17160 [Allorhodopirellula heiligendammensis]
MFLRFAFLVCVALLSCSVSPAGTPADDSGRYQLIFVGDSGEFAEFFREHSGLRSLASKCRVVRYSVDDTLFKTRFAKSMPAGSSPPAFIFARPDSGVLYLATRDSLPASADAFYSDLRTCYRLAGEGSDGAETRDGGRARLGGRLLDSLGKLPAIRRELDGINSSLSRIRSDSAVLVALAVVAALLLAHLLTPPRPAR